MPTSTPELAATGVGRRTVRSLLWSVGSSPVRMGITFVRSVLLANLLAAHVDLFGEFAAAGSIVVVTSVVASLGIDGAFLNRTRETEDERRAADVLFTLKTLATLAWAVVLCAGALLFATGVIRFFLVGLTLTRAVSLFLDTPRVILTRRIAHRRMAVADVIELVGSASFSVALALGGATKWALMGGEVLAVIISGALLMVWRPFWRPRFDLDPAIVRYYLGFSRQAVPARLFMLVTDRLDDLWTRTVLGATSLGYYSRAYRFATFPRSFLVGPLSSVVRGAYAELKGDRVRLSATYRAANTLLLTSGFLSTGGLILTAPEIVAVLLDPVWRPIVVPFQLMMLFTLTDPLRLSLVDMLVSLGEPSPVLRSAALQLAVLAVGLGLLGPRYGIEGVAVAVDIMALVGVAHLARRARRHVDVPFHTLWLPPAVATAAGIALALAAVRLLGPAPSPWLGGATKGIVFALGFAGALWVVQRQTLRDLWAMLRPTLRR